MARSKVEREGQDGHGLVVPLEQDGLNNPGETRVSKMVAAMSDLIPGNMVVKHVSRAVGGLKDFLQSELRERRAHELKMHKMNLDYNGKNPCHPLKAAKQKRKFRMKVQKGDVALGVNFDSDKGHDF